MQILLPQCKNSAVVSGFLQKLDIL
jgi:hypothetical protein